MVYTPCAQPREERGPTDSPSHLCADPQECYTPGHLAHIFLSFLDRYVLIRSHDLDSHDHLPVQQSHLVGNFIVPSFCTLSIVLFLW